jgi:tRNA pseudouridine38-40 synthase
LIVRKIKLTLEYDGTGYLGWQVQLRGPTIQGILEEKLSSITGERIRVMGSGRTDAGTHAFGQVAHFRTGTGIDVGALRRAMNSLLPPEIVIRKAEEVSDDFHARKQAKSKIYEYRILNRKTRSAFYHRYAWHVPYPLDFDAMREAAQSLVGEHDFASFRSVGSPTRTSVRTVARADWRRGQKGLIFFEIEANGFLKQMVRAIIGTLVEVGKGRIDCENFQAIIESRDRKRAGPTAPAHGLFLKEVKY